MVRAWALAVLTTQNRLPIFSRPTKLTSNRKIEEDLPSETVL